MLYLSPHWDGDFFITFYLYSELMDCLLIFQKTLYVNVFPSLFWIFLKLWIYCYRTRNKTVHLSVYQGRWRILELDSGITWRISKLSKDLWKHVIKSTGWSREMEKYVIKAKFIKIHYQKELQNRFQGIIYELLNSWMKTSITD